MKQNYALEVDDVKMMLIIVQMSQWLIVFSPQKQTHLKCTVPNDYTQ